VKMAFVMWGRLRDQDHVESNISSLYQLDGCN
jgi:hypothetical protein